MQSSGAYLPRSFRISCSTRYIHSMTAEPHVLIVDDERDILDPLASYLSKNGFRVSKAGDIAARTHGHCCPRVDIALIDIMMPGEDGLSLAGFIRATSRVPVILLTAKIEETDRIVGLELGADDYVTKPFSPRELVARIKAVLRRTSDSQVRAPDADAYAFGDWVLRTGERRAGRHSNGTAVQLSSGEYNSYVCLWPLTPSAYCIRDQTALRP